MTEYSISAPPAADLEKFLSTVCEKESIKTSPEALRLIIQAQSCCPRTCLTALQLLSNLGEITVDAVRQYFRFGQVEKLVRSLEQLSTDPKSALGIIGELLDTEGPTWVQENTVLVVTSAVRASVGAKPSIQVPPSLYSTRGPVWLQVARQMSSLDKPSPADVEAVLLEAVPNLPPAAAIPPYGWKEVVSAPDAPSPTPPAAVVVVAPIAPAPSPVAAPPPPPPPPPPAPKPQPQPAPIPAKAAKPKTMELDGVKFTSDESLTSLDNRIEHGTRGAPQPDSAATQGVEYDKAREPMSEKEFSRGFIQRFRKEN